MFLQHHLWLLFTEKIRRMNYKLYTQKCITNKKVYNQILGTNNQLIDQLIILNINALLENQRNLLLFIIL